MSQLLEQGMGTFRSADELQHWLNFVVNVAARNPPGQIGAILMDADTFIQGVRRRVPVIQPGMMVPPNPNQRQQ